MSSDLLAKLYPAGATPLYPIGVRWCQSAQVNRGEGGVGFEPTTCLLSLLDTMLPTIYSCIEQTTASPVF